jgi:branched-subunit amino acid transport protein
VSEFLAILLAGIGVYMTRAIFILVLAERRFPPLILSALEYVAPAVMGALIVAMLTGSSGQVSLAAPELAGLACAAVVAFTTRNHSYTVISAMLVFWTVGALL